jgi:UPF0755 protein
MEIPRFNKKYLVVGAVAVVVAVVILAVVFFMDLRPASTDASAPAVIFSVNSGQGFMDIANALKTAGLIRSTWAFDIAAALDGHAATLKSGEYQLSPSMGTSQIIAALSSAAAQEATVTIPEGSNIYDIDRILSAASVIHPGAFADFAKAQGLEGHLFPDTYQFFLGENVQNIVGTMTSDFNAKAAPLLAADSANGARNLIIASIVEKEVPDQNDQEIVAGIILKRLAAGMPLDIDATVCYAKLLAATSTEGGVCSLTALDFKIDSPYNTYLYKGLPPAPIGNPGVSAITAAIHPQTTPYLYYLTDPATGKTIFAKTLDEQNQNRVKYLERN